MAPARDSRRAKAPESAAPAATARSGRRAPSGLALRSGAPPIQARLEVNRPGDPFEQQAEAVADRVMRSPTPSTPPAEPPTPPTIQRAPSPDQEDVRAAQDPRAIQRAPSPDQEDVRAAQDPRAIQRAPSPDQEDVRAAQDPRAIQRSGGGDPPAVSSRTAAAIRSPGPGQPLAPGIRRRVEPHLGVDLSHVRVHSDASASRAAASLHATAFTHQSHIFLRKPASSGDLRLMAHEATHVVQQGAAVQRSPLAGQAPELQRLPALVASRLDEYARYIPGYSLFTVIVGFNPITGADVPRTPMNLVRGLMGLVPFGEAIYQKLSELGILQAAFDFISAELERFDLSLGRLERMIDEAYEEMDFVRLDIFDYNLGVLTRKFRQLLDDVTGFAGSLVARVIELIKEAAIGLAESALAENRAWALIKKIIQYDPLRGEPVTAAPVEILEDFLRLIGKETELEQMRERGTLQETADWIATQVGQFMDLLDALRGLISRAWDAIQPENLANLSTNITSLAADVGTFLGRVWDFAVTVAAKVLELIKHALLSWLSGFAHTVPGFHLVTVILGRNPFTGETVPRTAENIIRGFITLLPGGEQKYEQLQQTGTIAEAAARIEGAMAELGISWEMITGLFLGIWEGLTIDDLVDPLGAFQRIVDQFGEPIGRLFAFIQVVLREIFSLILALMNFPSDILGRIIDNAMQAIEDIKRDPAAFFNHLLEAVKLGFTHFFDNILQHLLNGLTDWLFGQLRKAGIEPPADLSLGSILGMVLEVLGISMERIWQKLGERIGPERVAQIRGAIDRLTGIWTFVRDVQERGVAAIWEYIESQISNLWTMVLEQAKAWIMREVIERVTARLLSMLDPTGIMAVVNSFIAFFNAVQSAIEYLREILLIVDDYVSTIAAVAQGNVEPGAAKMERGLASAIPVAIGFLANQVGLGNLAEKLAEIIAGLRELIDQALTWLIDRAVSLGEAALGALGLGGGREEPAPAAPATPDANGNYDGETIPPGLPPAEVKQRVLDIVQSRLATGSFNSTEAVHTLLQGVLNANRDRGLHGLRARVENQETFEVVVEASASPAEPRRFTWAQIFGPTGPSPETEADKLRSRLSRATQSSYAALVVDGRQIGSITRSGTRDMHAEEALVRSPSWHEAVNAARANVASSGSARITLLINRTPCASCVEWLKSAIAEARGLLGLYAGQVTFLLATTGTYRRRAQLTSEELNTITAGAQRIAERAGTDFDQVFEEQRRIWVEDVESTSTEWQVDGQTNYSGLSDLATAGWQLAGIDTGRPPTPRQLEFLQIAQRLAEQFGWGS